MQYNFLSQVLCNNACITAAYVPFVQHNQQYRKLHQYSDIWSISVVMFRLNSTSLLQINLYFQIRAAFVNKISSSLAIQESPRTRRMCIGSLFSERNQGNKMKAKKKLLLPEEKTLVHGDSKLLDHDLSICHHFPF